MTLPPSFFATGTGIVSMARQVGIVLGVAAVVAVLGTSANSLSLADNRRGWVLVFAASVAASIVTVAIGRRPTVAASGPALDTTLGAPRTIGFMAPDASG